VASHAVGIHPAGAVAVIHIRQQGLAQGRAGDVHTCAVVGVSTGDVPALAGVGQLQGAALLRSAVADTAAITDVAVASVAVGGAGVSIGGDVNTTEAEAGFARLLPP
ncbi:MAG: hypothetical protein ACK56I_32480, partial [bacterium]